MYASPRSHDSMVMFCKRESDFQLFRRRKTYWWIILRVFPSFKPLQNVFSLSWFFSSKLEDNIWDQEKLFLKKYKLQNLFILWKFNVKCVHIALILNMRAKFCHELKSFEKRKYGRFYGHKLCTVDKFVANLFFCCLAVKTAIWQQHLIQSVPLWQQGAGPIGPVWLNIVFFAHFLQHHSRRLLKTIKVSAAKELFKELYIGFARKILFCILRENSFRKF